MAGNFGYAGTGAGIVKVVHILFGLISLGCVAASFDSEEFKERFFLGGVATCFIISLFYYIAHLASYELTYSTANRITGAVYHFIGAALLIVGASLFLELVVGMNRYCKNLPVGYEPSHELCHKFDTKVSGGAFGLINGVLYLVAIVLTGLSGGDAEEYDDVYKPEGAK